MDLCNLDVIRVLLAKHGFSFSKGLGQNFLCEPSVPRDIAELAGIDEETCVLEVGPGIGTLTQELCRRAKKVVAIELDKRLPALLADTMGEFDNFTLLSGDVLKVDLPQIVRTHFPDARRIVACANLPYYITTPAISALIDSRCFDSITVMVQKEVADRICAAAGTADYGAFTPYIAYHAQARTVLEVGRECFVPSPKVDSAVVRMDLYKTPPVEVCDETLFFQVVKAAFAQRRKTLPNCLGTGFGSRLDKGQLRACMESCGIDPGVRGERLDIAAFAALTNAIGAALAEGAEK